MAHTRLDVYLGDQHKLGQLYQDGRHYVFEYAGDAIADVSLTMPRRAEPYRFPEIHPIFQMHLPEGPVRQLLSHVVAKSEGYGGLSLLLHLSDNQHARLRYALPGKQPNAPKTTVDDKPNAINTERLFAQLMGQYTKTSAQANVQPRINASLQGKATLPSAFYMIKTWGNEYPELACNEYACLEFAKHFGLNVPESQLSDKGKTLLSTRFDARKGELPLGFEDFAVLQGKTPAQRYDSSLEACARTARVFCSIEHREHALRDFFKLTLLNTVIRNGDAHLKNFGITYAHPNERKLATFFDLTTTTVYLPDDFMALKLNGSKAWPSRQDLIQFGQTHCALTPKQIDLCFDELTQALVQGRSALYQLTTLRPDFLHIAEHMEQQWTQAHAELMK